MNDKKLLSIINENPSYLQIINVMILCCYYGALEFINFKLNKRGILISGDKHYGLEMGSGCYIFCSQPQILYYIDSIEKNQKNPDNIIKFIIGEMVHELVHSIREEGMAMGGHYAQEIVSHMVQFLWHPENLHFQNQIKGSIKNIRAKVNDKRRRINRIYDVAILVALVFIVHRLRRFPQSRSFKQIMDFDKLSLEEQLNTLQNLGNTLHWYNKKERKKVIGKIVREFFPYTRKNLEKLYTIAEEELNMGIRLKDLGVE